MQRGLSDLDVTVKAIGVWDTVGMHSDHQTLVEQCLTLSGSLGLPRVNILTRVGLQTDQSKEMSFYDTKLSNCVENAFQALALDERRTSFGPAIWEKPPGNTTVTILMSLIIPLTDSNQFQ